MPADNNRGSKRAAAQRRIEQKRAAEAAARAAAARRRRNLIGGVSAAAIVVIALVVVFVVQSNRTTTSASSATPAHTISNGTVIPVGAATASTGTTAAAPSSSAGTGSPVVVDLYEDLQCPNCKAFEDQSRSTLAQLVAEGKAVLHYHPMSFLDSSANQNFSTRALNAAAVVVNTAGDQAFQKFHDLIYAHQSPETGPGLTDAQLISYAQQAGASGPAVEKAIKNLTYADWIKKVTDQASKDGVTGTPTVKVDGKQLQDLSPSAVTSAVDAAVNG